MDSPDRLRSTTGHIDGLSGDLRKSSRKAALLIHQYTTLVRLLGRVGQSKFIQINQAAIGIFCPQIRPTFLNNLNNASRCDSGV